MEVKFIKRLAELMNAEGLKQLELTTDAGSIWLERDSSVTVVDAEVRQKVPESMDQRVVLKRPAKSVRRSAVKEVKTKTGKVYEIRSPIQGVFYTALEPTDPPFVTIGQEVHDGDLLCVIGLNGIMNEIESEVGGEVSEILVQNGQRVSFDQILFKIKKG